MKRLWLTLSLILLIAGGLRPVPAVASPAAKTAAGVRASLASAGEAHVIVVLAGVPAAADGSAQSVSALHRLQDSVLNALPADGFALSQRFDYTPAIAGVVTDAGMAALEKNPAVVQILVDEPSSAFLGQAVPLIHADVVQDSLGITGEGVTAAVLDTGIDTNHPDLSDDLVAQKCYTHSACPPSNTSESNNAEDGHGHGTNVSGIISGKGVVAPRGFAPDTGIAAVKVLSDSGSGYLSDWVKGLEWVYDNRATHHISLVNMSLGTNTLYTGNCDAESPVPVPILTLLYNAGITVFAASGNSANSTQLASPACNSHTVAVGAVYDANIGGISWGVLGSICTDTSTYAGKITCFTNSNNQLDILAPGALIYGPDAGGGADEYGGTSQASPAAVGVAALMLESNPKLTPDQILNFMKSTGISTNDPSNNLSFPLIDAEAAVKASSPLNAAFTVSPRMQLKQIAVGFTNDSTGIGYSCAWKLGDGGTSTSCTTFNHLYNPGLYTVSLKITNSTETSSLEHSRYIGIGDTKAIPYPIPAPGFSVSIYPGLTVTIPMTSTNQTGSMVMIPRPVDLAPAPPKDTGHYYPFDLEPDGFLFTKPYTLTIDIADFDPGRAIPDELSLYSWSSGSSSWNLVTSTFISDTVTAVISPTYNTTQTWSLIAPLRSLFMPIIKK